SDSPLLYAIYFNYGNLLGGGGDLQAGIDALIEAIRLNPDFLSTYLNLGMMLERAGNLREAVARWYDAVNRLKGVSLESIGYKTMALKHIARILESSGIDANAEETMQLSLDLDRYQPDVLQHWINARQKQCKWPVLKPWGNVTRDHLLRNISPL